MESLAKESSSEDSLIKGSGVSNTRTTYWFLVLAFIPQIFFSMVFITLSKVIGLKGNYSADTGYYEVIGIVAVCLSPLLFFPLLKRAYYSESYNSLFDTMRVHRIPVNQALSFIFITLFAIAFIEGYSSWQHLPVEASMLDVKTVSGSTFAFTLMIFAMCFVAPVTEELIFRGWLYERLVQTKLGTVGTILISSALFSAIHFQYEYASTFTFIFVFGCLLGFARHRSANLAVPILMHFVFNVGALINMVYFTNIQ